MSARDIVTWYNSVGGVAEWSKAPVLKTGVGQPTVSSNLTPSAYDLYPKKWTRGTGATAFFC